MSSDALLDWSKYEKSLIVDRLKVNTTASLPNTSITSTAGDFTVGADLQVTNDADVDGDLNVDGILTVAQASNLNTLDVTGPSTLGSLAASSADVTITRGATVGEALTVTGQATVGSLSTAGTATIGGLIIPGATAGNVLQCTSGGLFVEKTVSQMVAPLDGLGAVQLGVGADTTGTNAVAIGSHATAANNAIAIGAGDTPNITNAFAQAICLNATPSTGAASTGSLTIQTGGGSLITGFVEDSGVTNSVWDRRWIVILNGQQYYIPLKNYP